MRAAWTPAGLACLLAAVVWLALAAPEAGRLPADYAARFDFDVRARSRDAVDGAWRTVRLTARRDDSTLLSTGGRSIIQSDVLWLLPDGGLLFENTGLYAVDRESRANLPGLGDVSRRGHFLFPPRPGARELEMWDSQFLGPRRMRFERVEQGGGLPMQRWTFRVDGLDETAGYAHLADVPERYRAHTQGEGRLLVDPASGTVVDYEERGRSHYVDAGGRDIGAFHEWSARYAPATRAAQLQRALAEVREARSTRYGVPAALALPGLVLLLVGQRRARRPRAAA